MEANQILTGLVLLRWFPLPHEPLAGHSELLSGFLLSLNASFRERHQGAAHREAPLPGYPPHLGRDGCGNRHTLANCLRPWTRGSRSGSADHRVIIQWLNHCGARKLAA
jgi:hypothetical protein